MRHFVQKGLVNSLYLNTRNWVRFVIYNGQQLGSNRSQLAKATVTSGEHRRLDAASSKRLSLWIEITNFLSRAKYVQDYRYRAVRRISIVCTICRHRAT